jgi:hypothetical protein
MYYIEMHWRKTRYKVEVQNRGKKKEKKRGESVGDQSGVAFIGQYFFIFSIFFEIMGMKVLNV